MRVLVLTQYYTPEPPLRPCELAPSLVRRGHEVTVVTGFPCYPFSRVYDGYKPTRWRWEIVGGVRVLRLPVLADHSLSGLRRAAYYSSIAACASAAVPLLSGRYDVAFAYTPPPTLGVPAVLGKWLRGIPYVCDVQDVWPESLPATGFRASQPLLRTVDWLGRFVYRESAAVTVISPGFKQRLRDKGVPSDKIHVVPNWADEQVYKPLPRDEHLAASLGMSGRFNVVYAGNMGLAQSLTSVVEAAALLRETPDIQFVLVGDGIQRAELEGLANRYGLANVRFLGRREPREVNRIFALADVLLVHLCRDPLFSVTIPSKIPAYLAAGRPILAAVEGDAADVVVGGGAGLACIPQNPSALAQAVYTLHAVPAGVRERLGANARRLFLAEFTKDVLVGRLEQLLFEVARTRGSAK
jgi:glycosyltransferase involved in cell wall biosynthesis